MKKFSFPAVDEKDVPIDAVTALTALADDAPDGAPAKFECLTDKGMFGLNRHTRFFYRWVLTNEDV